MKSRCIILATLMVFMTLAVTAMAQDSSDLRQRLMNTCLSQGENPSCCECGVDILVGGLTNEELVALVEIMELADEFEAAGDDQAKIDELLNKMAEHQATLDQATMEGLDQQIEAQCAGVCAN